MKILFISIETNFDFDNQVGDPRDQYKLSYRGLTYSQNQYWKKYSRTNNFWDYMRIINYYDNSLWTQLRNLTPKEQILH